MKKIYTTVKVKKETLSIIRELRWLIRAGSSDDVIRYLLDKEIEVNPILKKNSQKNNNKIEILNIPSFQSLPSTSIE